MFPSRRQSPRSLTRWQRPKPRSRRSTISISGWPAEYDNFRKRSQKEKDNIYRDAKADTTEKFLPVFDNLSRALEQETADAAYKKGVEMTMTGLLEILKKLDVTVYGEAGETFSPEFHNAVMHIEDDNYKEGEIVQVFQKGFKLGDKVIRFAMVQTAN